MIPIKTFYFFELSDNFNEDVEIHNTKAYFLINVFATGDFSYARFFEKSFYDDISKFSGYFHKRVAFGIAFLAQTYSKFNWIV